MGYCSVFAGVRKKVYLNMRVHQILSLIKNGTFDVAIRKLRSLRGLNDTEFDKEKSNLLSFTPAATFDLFRNHNRIRSLSGILVLDFDNLDDVISAKKKVIQHPYTLACFVSPSGKGLKVLVKTFSHPYATYFLSYQAAVRYYQKVLKQGLDKAEDVTRLCFVSHDPELFWNPKSLKINLRFLNIMKLKEIYSNVNEQVSKKSSGKKFLYSFCRLARKYGHTPKQCFDFLNKKDISNDFQKDDFEKQYLEIDKKEKSSRKRRRNQKYFGEQTNDKMADFEEYLETNYDAYHDQILDATFIKRKKYDHYQKLNDRILNSIWHEFNSQSKSYLSMSIIELLLSSSIVKGDSGLNQFIKELPKPDGQDHIKAITDTVVTTNQDIFYDRFKRWFIGMVACVLNKDVVNDLVLVFTGGQGIGKTRFFKRLMLDKLSMYYVSKLPKMRDKDTEIMLAENVLVVIDEIDALNFKENTALKELTTTQKVKVRKPYDKKQEEYKRYATFAGTTNRKQFLTDTTGSRRFLCFDVQRIDQNVELPVREAFVQAIAELQSGYQYWLNEEDIKIQEAMNEEFQFIDAEEELLLNFTRKPVLGDDDKDMNWEQTTMLLQKLLKIADMPRTISNIAVRKLGAALSKHDYPRKSQNGRKKWGLVFVEEDGLTPMDQGELFSAVPETQNA